MCVYYAVGLHASRAYWQYTSSISSEALSSDIADGHRHGEEKKYL